jgi:LuxR family transcriptional regulator, maltose regulon positive regulatory protein
VTAPAGYGKTSHLAAWVAAEQRPNAWIDLDESHNDINWILAALSGALGDITDLSDDELMRLTAAGATPAQVTTRVAPEFGRALAQCDVPFVLVLDGLEVISDLSSLDLLDALVCNVPAGSTVALAGRRVALRSLPRLRADSGLVEFSIDDLKLGPIEARMVVDEMEIDLGDDRVERLTAAAEGWPIAVRLGALAMQAGEGGTDVPVEFDGRDHLISDYLSSEWLRGLSLAERDVLMRSSVLEEMSGAMCDHVLGRSDSGAVLHRIHGERLLVIPLDRRNESYRMHSLLREALLAEFERADSVGLRDAHRKASEWFLTTGDVDRAVRHRLAAGDLEAVEQLIAAHAPAWFTSGRYATVKRWLQAVPTEHMVQNPSLCLAAAMTSLGLGDEATTATWLRFAESAVGQESAAVPARVRLQVLAFRSLMNTGPIVPALNDARRAYQGLPPGIWHAASCIAYGVALWAHGDEGAEGILVEGAQEAAVWHAPSLEANCRAMLAMFAHAAGDRRRARQLATEARQLLIDHGLEQSPTPVSVIAMCALVAAEDGDPKKAREDLQLARRNLTYFEETAGWTNVQSRLMLAHAGLALGSAGVRRAADRLLSMRGGAVRVRPGGAGCRSKTTFLRLPVKAYGALSS